MKFSGQQLSKPWMLSPSFCYFNTIGTNYYIAFPCMHIAQPLVVLWFFARVEAHRKYFWQPTMYFGSARLASAMALFDVREMLPSS
jgi:hypothetical protein